MSGPREVRSTKTSDIIVEHCSRHKSDPLAKECDRKQFCSSIRTITAILKCNTQPNRMAVSTRSPR